MFSPKTPISLKYLAQKSVYGLHDSGANLPFQPSPNPKMTDISIAAEGIDNLLKGLGLHKAAGPNKFKPFALQTLHNELAPILQLILQRSIDTGEKTDIWKEANVSPIYKKGRNIGPIQIQANLIDLCPVQNLEDADASSLVKRFTELDTFYKMQHGFRDKVSCKTQLIVLIDELAKNMQMGKQTDLIFSDFSKTFDKVAHEKLLLKLHHYGIRGDTLKWIEDFWIIENRRMYSMELTQ